MTYCPPYAWAFVMSAEKHDRWAAGAERLVEAGEHLANRIVSDTAFFSSLGLHRDAIRLVRVDPGYKRCCVLCRPDGIPVGDDVKFVELNCDSPAMMSFLDLVARCVVELDAFAPLRRDVAMPTASDRLLDTLLSCYREFGGNDTPSIAITDWEGQKTRYEHRSLAAHFDARGCPTVVCDPRAFRRVDGELHVNDRKIQLVYRRAIIVGGHRASN